METAPEIVDYLKGNLPPEFKGLHVVLLAEEQFGLQVIRLMVANVPAGSDKLDVFYAEPKVEFRQEDFKDDGAAAPLTDKEGWLLKQVEVKGLPKMPNRRQSNAKKAADQVIRYLKKHAKAFGSDS